MAKRTSKQRNTEYILNRLIGEQSRRSEMICGSVIIHILGMDDIKIRIKIL